MRDPGQFEHFVRGALAQHGLDVDEIEMRVILAAEAAYGPAREALIAADLSDVPAEVPFDPSRSPHSRDELDEDR